MSVPTILPTDSARTRRSDPITSHLAGDRSQANVKGVSLGVLHLVNARTHTAGSEINELYGRMWAGHGWPKAATDTPRKRSSELCRDGLIVAVDFTKGVRCMERVFAITEQGKRELGIK